ncbi:MAG: His-Xaa-Ser system radical SAM maturase HxsB [Nitrobacter sp.]|uniref:His-Xaa-Ser system radical SAM maturase HxsB n=1 Tax=Nitrobacter sp. TaxID=29420 RepID=UPI002638D73A|nr:His-Xaa-Ser system radical SAM maturase HxsB [Nitrobacter sp.]MCV0387082.1 His-Xaa-Ser system radical SAM maturase HxsB [Nitrobacter sp.]
MARFLPPDAFHSSAPIELLPIRFERRGPGRVLVSNMVGDFISLTDDEFDRIASLRLSPSETLYETAFAAHLIGRRGQTAQLQLLATRLRSRMAFLRTPSALHLFVVTLRCEHSCPYCQVSRQSSDRSRFDMSEETAERALAIALESPSPAIKLEFQGGEPLLNFPLIEKIVANAKAQAPRVGKTIQFVITSNLALLSDDILSFCKSNEVMISTSLDGPADLHNKNRPRPGGNSHDLAVKGIKRAQQILGKDRVGALMTTTDRSLDRVEQIINEYRSLDLDGIFLRPLSPYGFAVKTRQVTKYDTNRWLEFYSKGLRYILDLNRRGERFTEFYTSLMLTRMLSDRPTGYVDLRSPAGTGLGALVYNYDGRVFASDEGRMLAEMGDDAFVLGKVADASYRSLVLSDKLLRMVADSLSQCAPECHACVFESHCGADPTYHHATQGDHVGIKPLSGFCTRQKSVMRTIIDLLHGSPDDATILRGWVA